MTHTRFLLAAVSALALAGAAKATIYDAVADFSTTSSTGVFSYGTGVTGSSFTPYPVLTADCLGAGSYCWQTTTPVLLVPLVAANQSGSTINFGSVVFPTNVLNVHPGPSTDSIVRFTAPTSGMYDISGFYELLDTDPSGVNAIIALDGAVIASTLLTGPGATHPGTPGESFTFGASHVFLLAGTIIDYGVNNDGSFFNDSTGLALTVTSVPEPATWALVLAGFGGLGAALRARRKAAVV